MSPVIRNTLLSALLVCMGGNALAGESGKARDWLERMTTAMSQMSYQGTFVYARGGVIETMRITHLTDETGVRERLYSVSGPHREVIRDRKGVRCVFADSASVVGDQVVSSSYFPELPLSLIDGDASGYQLEIGGTARIAGQTARRVSISPEDKFRFGYDFWLEEQTGLLLKWVLFDASHKPLAKLMFTDFAMGSGIDMAEIESAADPKSFVEMKTFGLKKAAISQSTPRWQPAKLPPGFKLASHNRASAEEGLYEHMVYSDGLAAVSVYVEQLHSQLHVKQGVNQLGTNNAFIRTQDDMQITVIGEVPAVTVKSIANEMARSIAAE